METTHVLVPVSGTATSERALPVASALASRLGLPLRLVSFVSDPSEYGFQRRYVAELAARLKQGHPNRLVDTFVADIGSANPADAIVSAWSDWAVLVMASSCSVHQNGHFSGSVAETLLRRSGRPLLVVGPECDLSGFDPQRIVVPVDGSLLGEASIAVALEWADMFDVPATIVTVTAEPPGSPGAREKYVEHLAVTNSEKRRLTGGVIIGDDPAQDLVRTLAGGDLVVMSTHGRSGIDRIALGSVAAEVCRNALAPTVVYRPAENTFARSQQVGTQESSTNEADEQHPFAGQPSPCLID